VLREEKQALAEMQLALAALEVPREDLTTLEQAILQLDELFLLVVVGEFNAGKSALINALLGQRILPEGVTPTTSKVTLVKWGEQISEQAAGQGVAVLTFPLPILEQINIVDTPGTNAVIRQHEQLTTEFVPRSDLVLFVTSTDRPMTESERQFLEQIRAWGKKVVIALNKADILQNQAEAEEVRRFVLKYAEGVLGLTPELFLVSARQAEQANAETDPERSARLRESSGVEELIRYIDTTLDDRARLQLKLANPLGVMEHILEQAQVYAASQAGTLNEDKETAAAVEALISGYESDLQKELSPRLAEIDNILARFQERGLDFFDTTMRLTNITTLARGDRVRAEFEKQVLANVPQQVEDRVQRLIDWLIEKDLRQWQQLVSYLQRRQARYTEHIVGEQVAPLDNRRRTLLDSVGRTAQTIVDAYDRDREAHELAANVEAAVAQVALIEVGAVGLGALVMTAIASSTLDITGMLAAGTLAVVGFFVIPYKRRQAKERFKTKVEALRQGLLDSLTVQFRNEAENVVTRMRDGIAPYTRFVRAEHERIEKTQHELTSLQDRVAALKARVDMI
jgi:small GTP-binding protein